MTKTIVQVIAATGALLLIGLASLWARQPWLMPSLGSAVFVQVLESTQPTAKPWNVGAGQVAGVVGGYVAVYLTPAHAASAFMAEHPLVAVRVLAAAIAVLVTMGLQLAINAKSAAGATTALILALGIDKPDGSTAGEMIVGIVMVVILGEIARRLTLAAEPASQPTGIGGPGRT